MSIAIPEINKGQLRDVCELIGFDWNDVETIALAPNIVTVVFYEGEIKHTVEIPVVGADL